MVHGHNRFGCDNSGEDHDAVACGSNALTLAARQVDPSVPGQPLVLGWIEGPYDERPRFERPYERRLGTGWGCEQNRDSERTAQACDEKSHRLSIPVDGPISSA